MPRLYGSTKPEGFDFHNRRLQPAVMKILPLTTWNLRFRQGSRIKPNRAESIIPLVRLFLSLVMGVSFTH
jgi:hypothetical protein